jgi:hypothetical protein
MGRHGACMGEMRNARRNLEGTSEGRRPVMKLKCRWKGKIEMDRNDRDWINVAQYTVRWRVLENMVVSGSIKNELLD